MHSNRVWRKEKELISALLEEYPNYEKYMEERMFELENPVGERDDNVGGGKAQNRYRNPVDHLLITMDEDHRLNELHRIHYALKGCIEETNDDCRLICKELYFKEPKLRVYGTIADLCHAGKLYMSKTKAYDEWDEFLHECARALDLPH